MVQIMQDDGDGGPTRTAQRALSVGNETFDIACLQTSLASLGGPGRFPVSIAILLEGMLRQGGFAFSDDVLESLRSWPRPGPLSVPFRPSRVLLQDYTGIPVLVDLAALQDEAAAQGLGLETFGCAIPADLVIDHSLVVDVAARPDAVATNEAAEMGRNRERFIFLKWAERNFPGLRLFPPVSGICHQINMELLSTVVEIVPAEGEGRRLLRPDTVLGADSHTTTIGGLGVLGWGVGGLEALSAVLGNAVTMALPEVIGVRLSGRLPPTATATDLVLSLVHRLREFGVVGRFVEFFGPGLATLPAAHRATVANMAPEAGATCLFFPVDEETLAYLRRTGRSPDQVAVVEAYCRAQGFWRGASADAAPGFTATIDVDLRTIGPSLAGPGRPDQHLTLQEATRVGRSLAGNSSREAADAEVRPGDVVLAAITSCTNTANPYSVAAAGLLARNAVQKGLSVKPWVKTSFAPGSRVVEAELRRTGLDRWLEALGFGIVGFGCTTCIGNAGPLQPIVAAALAQDPLPVAAVLSGNRNFANRVHPDIPANFLASPALVVAYALTGSMTVDLSSEPVGVGAGGAVYLEDIWPSESDIAAAVAMGAGGAVDRGSRDGWDEIDPSPTRSAWDLDPATVQRPPIQADTPPRQLGGLRIIGLFGDDVTTDHISPASPIRADSPAGRYLANLGVTPDRLHSFGARRGNWRAMLLGAFTNRALRNAVAPDEPAGMTRFWPEGSVMTIQDAAARYQAEAVGLVIVAGRNYGTGSSRDDAAKSTRFLGVKAVIAESFERIHRSNLLAMGVLPLTFPPGVSWRGLGWSGAEVLDLDLAAVAGPDSSVPCCVDGAAGPVLLARIETAEEEAFWRAGGLMPFLLAEAGRAQAVNSAAVRLATESGSSRGT